jgi:hypothetical protein
MYANLEVGEGGGVRSGLLRAVHHPHFRTNLAAWRSAKVWTEIDSHYLAHRRIRLILLVKFDKGVFTGKS